MLTFTANRGNGTFAGMSRSERVLVSIVVLGALIVTALVLLAALHHVTAALTPITTALP